MESLGQAATPLFAVGLRPRQAGGGSRAAGGAARPGGWAPGEARCRSGILQCGTRAVVGRRAGVCAIQPERPAPGVKPADEGDGRCCAAFPAPPVQRHVHRPLPP